MTRTIPIIGLTVLIMGCGSDPCFYSFSKRTFVPLEKRPAHKQLVGTWQTNDGRLLVLRPDGRAVRETTHSRVCWDVHGRKLLLHLTCGYGVQKGDPFVAIADVVHHCDFSLTHRLVLKNCPEAGEYWRAREPTVVPPASK